MDKTRNKQSERDDEHACAEESDAGVNESSQVSEIAEQAQVTLWVGTVTYRKTHKPKAAKHNSGYEKPSLKRHHIE